MHVLRRMLKRQIKLYKFLQIVWTENPKIIRSSFYPFNEIILKANYDDNGQGYSQNFTFSLKIIY